MTHLELCSMNKKPEAVFYKDMKPGEFDGHGVAIIGPDTNIIDCGLIESEIDTLMSGDGGTHIEPYYVVVHSKKYCEEGIYRASR